MRGLPKRAPRPDVEVAAGERLLAWASATDGQVLAGTRDALYLPSRTPSRVPWEQVEAADWDVETETLRVSEVGSWGEERPLHEFVLVEPQRFLQLVRERVTASIVLQRHVVVRGSRGVRVIGRRAPRGGSQVHWVYAYDEGIDPDDPEVRRLAESELAAARTDVGLL